MIIARLFAKTSEPIGLKISQYPFRVLLLFTFEHRSWILWNKNGLTVNIVWGVALLYYFVVSNFDFTLNPLCFTYKPLVKVLSFNAVVNRIQVLLLTMWIKPCDDQTLILTHAQCYLMTKISILTINGWVVLGIYTIFLGTLVQIRNNVYICVNSVNVICDINEGLCLTDMIR